VYVLLSFFVPLGDPSGQMDGAAFISLLLWPFRDSGQKVVFTGARIGC